MMTITRAARATRHTLILFAILACASCVDEQAGTNDDGILRVHEWGTFTALQDESGKALPGINIDDEPLPPFCHNLHPWAVVPARTIPHPMMKGVTERHPFVTLRLETPVLYFHPAASQTFPFTIDVDVKFHAGWLTEFYPQAEPDEPGLKRDAFHFGPIDSSTVGRLTWRNISVGSGSGGPATAEHVWLAPRKVRSANIVVPPQTSKDTAAEGEQFLFYRGVGNRPAPLRVIQDPSAGTIAIRSQCADVLRPHQSARVSALWIVDIRKDGAVAYWSLDPVTLGRDPSEVLASTPIHFPDSQYSSTNMKSLREGMHSALMNEGLFSDEATAMLDTWERAYFQSPGLRLFFIVPQAWTDAVLPLTLSRPADVRRVMMGRIELVSREQRQLLKKLADGPTSSPDWVNQIPYTGEGRKFHDGRSTFGRLDVSIPPDYQTYLDLGRFRNALVLEEQRVRPSPQLNEFINSYGLWSYQPD